MRRGLVWIFIWKNRWSYLLAVVTVGISKGIQVQIPHIIGQFINIFHTGTTMSVIEHYALELAVVSAVYVLLFGIGQFSVGKLARQFEASLRFRLFSHWETLESHYFQRHTVGDLLSHVLNDIPAVRQAMAGGISQILQAVFLFVATLIMTIAKINLNLTLISLIPLLMIPVVVVRLGPKIRRQSRLVQESLSKMSDMAEESLQSIRLVKSTANETVETRRFTAKADVIYEQSMQQVRLNTAFQALIPLLTGISFAIALSYGGDLVLRHQISLGAFVAFTVYLSMLVRPLMQFGNVINTFQNSSASLVRIQHLLNAEPQISDPLDPEPFPQGASIQIRDLTFRYPEAEGYALQHINLTIPAGSTLGIVGRTGAGKTTLCSLLLREIDPPTHTIFYRDIDIRHLSRSDLRTQVAYVPQEGFLFSTSIAENIAFPREQVVPSEVSEAADRARILQTVQEMPKAFDTIVGERGINLSGGQRQRVAMARALIKSEAQVLIFDDSLSAVDSRTEAEILKTLRELRRQGRTSIIVSHRLSSLRDADHIMVLEDGHMVEYGTPNQLLKTRGLYAHLYAIQSEGGEESGS